MPHRVTALPTLLLCASLSIAQSTHDLSITITSSLTHDNTPINQHIDFGAIIAADPQLLGVLDPSSIQIKNNTTQQTVPHALDEAFAHGQSGHVRWVINDPAHTTYTLTFQTAAARPQMTPQADTPRIGVGDLLHYSNGTPMPITAIHTHQLVDLNGDGKLDLVGNWNYGRSHGAPFSGLFCFPRTGSTSAFEFGDAVRLRYVDTPGATTYHDFSDPDKLHNYTASSFADFNDDGLGGGGAD